MFCSIQVLASCMALISYSIDLMVGHPFPFKVLINVGDSGLPLVMIAALSSSHRPLFADPSVYIVKSALGSLMRFRVSSLRVASALAAFFVK